MKTFMSYAIVALFLVGFASSFSTAATFENTVMSKKTTGFDYFRAHRQANGVALSWSAADAVAYKIERSYDSEFFDEVATVAAGGAAALKFNDENVFPGTIFYRVGAVKADGSIEYSAIESVRIVKHVK
jgi:hypothetical protein